MALFFRREKQPGHRHWQWGAVVLTLLLSLSLGCNFKYDRQKGGAITIAQQKVSDSAVWDFGEVKEGAILKHQFVLQNTLKKVLHIKDVATSCGCTASEVKKKTLQPGENTSIEVTFDSKGYSGRIQQFVYVTTDNLDNSILRFIIRANVMK